MKTYTFAEAMAARAKGKRVKPDSFPTFDNLGWRGWTLVTLEDCCSWHIEEPPTQVPWDCPEDVPMVVAFRDIGCHYRLASIVIEEDGITLARLGKVNWSELAKRCEHTIDGINWKPCTKEAK